MINQTSVVTQCIHCGNAIDLADRISQLGDIEKYRCKACKKEITMTVSHILTTKPLDQKCAVSVQWLGLRPSLAELHSLRAVFPDFRNVPIAEVASRIGQGPTLELGCYPMGKALDLQRAAQSHGLTVVIRDDKQ